MAPTVETYPTGAAVISAASDLVASEVRHAVAGSGRCTIVLSGGETPRALYARLAARPDGLPWSRIAWFFGDERWVPQDDPLSNYRMADEALFSHVPISRDRLFRVPTELAPPAAAAAAYEVALRAQFPGRDWPRFDLALMGLGADGHTASLVPGDAALGERTAWVTATRAGRPVPDRITLTIPVFAHAQTMMFLVAGGAKADAVAATLEGPRDPVQWPAQAVEPIDGRCRWLLDREAAGRLAR
ncbi:MAG: 6-phosphogluconolactonase [Nitrospiria bacterium]